MGLEGIVSKRKDSMYRSGRSPDWLKMKNPEAPAVKREEDEEWGKRPALIRSRVNAGAKIGRPKERAAQGSEV
jgi:ATP-dependent DNA ligase